MDFSFFLKFKGLGFLSTEGESVVKYGELLNLSISNHFLQGLLQLNLCYGILPKPPMLSITSQKKDFPMPNVERLKDRNKFQRQNFLFNLW